MVLSATATTAAATLSKLYDENFGGNYEEPYRISWPELRMIAGVSKLTDPFISEISSTLINHELFLIPFNNFILIAKEQDLRRHRRVPGRLLEQNIYDPEEEREKEDIEIDDDDVNCI